MNYWKKLKRTPNKVAILIVRFYRLTLSPSVGIFRFLPFFPKNSCIFYPTCSEYSITCFEKYSFLKAFRKTINRIGRCNSRNEPSIDLP